MPLGCDNSGKWFTQLIAPYSLFQARGKIMLVKEAGGGGSETVHFLNGNSKCNGSRGPHVVPACPSVNPCTSWR
jgi:hypothetical protein